MKENRFTKLDEASSGTLIEMMFVTEFKNAFRPLLNIPGVLHMQNMHNFLNIMQNFLNIMQHFLNINCRTIAKGLSEVLVHPPYYQKMSVLVLVPEINATYTRRSRARGTLLIIEHYCTQYSGMYRSN